MKEKSFSTLVRPWGEQWQLWRRNPKGAAWKIAQEGDWQTLKIPADAVFAIPARLTVAHPFFVDAAEETVVREMAWLEVEMSGLTPRERVAGDVELRLLRREENRTLVLAIVYPPEWPSKLRGLKAAVAEASPLLAVWSDNTVHLWRENEDLVAAVTWNGQVVYWETIHWTEDRSEIRTWLRCIVLQLQEELGLPETMALKEWTAVFQEVPEGFVREKSWSDRDRAEGAIPTGAVSSAWLPGHLRTLAEKRRNQRVVVKAGLAVAAVALVAAVGIAYAFASLHWREQEAEGEIARLEEETAPIRRVAERWRHVEAAVDGKFYAVEVLHVVVASLPARNVRLTTFEMSPEKILVEGEAGNVRAATEFFERLQENPEAPDLHWEMASPSLQPDNTARFVMSGVRERGADE